MDNQPRIPEGHHVYYEHCHQTWVDACMQAVLADRILVRMAGELGREADALQFAQEAESLTAWINRELWDEDTRFYHDLRADGTRITGVKTIGAYWALLAGVVPADRLEAFLSHLKDPLVFNRPHRVPSLSADTPGYVPGGGYWMGGVWPPSNYMLLCGLNSLGREELAHEIGLNHVSNIAAAFALTGTLWENYAPDFFGNGCSARDFVGWTGIPPVAVLFEQVFGLKAEPAQRKLTWHPRVLEEHGVNNYPFGGHASLDLRCLARTSPEEEPKVECRSNEPLRIELRWGTKGASRIIEV